MINGIESSCLSLTLLHFCLDRLRKQSQTENHLGVYSRVSAMESIKPQRPIIAKTLKRRKMMMSSIVSAHCRVISVLLEEWNQWVESLTHRLSWSRGRPSPWSSWKCKWVLVSRALSLRIPHMSKLSGCSRSHRRQVSHSSRTTRRTSLPGHRV